MTLSLTLSNSLLHDSTVQSVYQNLGYLASNLDDNIQDATFQPNVFCTQPPSNILEEFSNLCWDHQAETSQLHLSAFLFAKGNIL